MSVPSVPPLSQGASSGAIREFLTFCLAAEEYAVDILSVLEIRSYEGITALPGLPAEIKGVINLRGIIVPVVDLRLRFRMADPAYDCTTALVVVNLGPRTVALVVDRVSEVAALSGHQIRPAPQMGATLDTTFISGIGSLGERMLILLDLAALLGTRDLAAMPGELAQAA